MLSVLFSRTSYVQSSRLAGYTGASFFLQTSPTPQPEVDKSEVGSTDGITLMSFVIVAIIIIPIVLQRKYWSTQV
jgi:hypothetical protein